MRNPAEVDKPQVVARRLTAALIDRNPTRVFQKITWRRNVSMKASTATRSLCAPKNNADFISLTEYYSLLRFGGIDMSSRSGCKSCLSSILTLSRAKRFA
jgi:hypothetical protein